MMSWRRWSEPWFLTYGLLAIIAAGITPILLPQFVNLHGNASQVGLVMAALSLGGLTAPIWGWLAERRLHKELIAGGLVVVAVSLALLPGGKGVTFWLIMALLQGAGLTAVITVSGLLIVERHPKDEWDQRMGWLMTTFGIGQVVGLVIASFFSGTKSDTGMFIGAGFTVLALLLAVRFIHTPPKPVQPQRAGPQAVRVPHIAASPGSTHHHLGHVSRREALRALQSPFGEFLISISLLTLASGLIFIPYPLLFSTGYHVSPSSSSLAFGVAAALAILWYPLAGTLSHKRGAMNVLTGSLVVRWFSFAALLVLAMMTISARGYLAEASFLLTVNTWPFITVSATVAAAELAPTDEGTTMGIYNGVTSLVNTISALAAGLIASSMGYKSLPVFAAVILIGAVVSAIHIGRKQRANKMAASKVEAQS